MRTIAISCLFFILFATLSAQNSDIERKLFELPDVIFKPIDVPKGYRAAYELRIKQPINHNKPSEGYFYQRAFLSHKDFDKPTVIVTEGYDQSRNRISEPTLLIDANQLIVEHRYFGQSIPEDVDYTYLNLEQEAADLHTINNIFKNVYSGKWISTGISKGGQTTIYYRYFYPNDVDVSIPYVAPINLDIVEPRFFNFLDTIGSNECRDKIKAIQVNVLENRTKALEYLRWYCYGASLNFTYMSFEEAFEYMVLEYPYSFWQWGYNCADIPDTSAHFDEVLVHLLNVSNIDFFSDDEMTKYAPHYYQAATEMGYYGYKTDSFEKYLKVIPLSPRPNAAFAPKNIDIEFDNKLSKKTCKWLQTSGDKFIYIYGARDFWTAAAIQPNEERDALWFFLENKDHAGARIQNLSQANQQKIVSVLERWLNLDVKPKYPFVFQ